MCLYKCQQPQRVRQASKGGGEKNQHAHYGAEEEEGKTELSMTNGPNAKEIRATRSILDEDERWRDSNLYSVSHEWGDSGQVTQPLILEKLLI